MMETSIWHFRAEADPRRVHTVSKNEEGYTCTCPVFTYSKGKDCRHVRLVRNGLAGLAINEEPELAWGAVEHVQKYRGKVLVPFFRDEDQESFYLILWELRQLGFSKRKCSEFLGVRAVSDALIESFLKTRGMITEKGEVDAEEENDEAEEETGPTLEVKLEEVAAECQVAQ